MTIIACLEAVALIAVVALLLRNHAETEAQWALERRELLNRIVRPDRLPTTPVEQFEVPERDPDEWGKVGQVTISDKWLNGED